MAPTETVTICIPSAGNEWLTELAVLSAQRLSSSPLRFRIGGSIGSEQETLGQLAQRVDLEIETAPRRMHAEWLDHWVADLDSRYAIFLDSDVFFRKRCWVAPLMQELSAGTALVTPGISKRETGVIEPIRGETTTAMPCPEAFMMGVNVEEIRSTGASFAYQNRTENGEILAWDVAGKVLETLTETGKPVHVLPESYSRFYTHIGSMSWRESPHAWNEQRRWLHLQEARVRLARERWGR